MSMGMYGHAMTQRIGRALCSGMLTASVFVYISRWRQRVQQEHLDGEGVRRRRRVPVHHLLLPQLLRRAGPAGERGRVRDVPRVGPALHAWRAHERDGAGQGDAGELPAARVLEPGWARQRRRAGARAAAVRVAARRAGRGAAALVGARGARGRHAAGLPGAHGDRGAHPRRHGRPHRRVRRQLHRRRRRDAAGGTGPGPGVRQGVGAVGEPAHHAALHGQLAEPHRREGRQGVRPVRGVLPGDHGLRGRCQPPGVPVPDAQARPGVQPRHGLQVLVLGCACMH